MIKRINTRYFNLKIVLRHRFEKLPNRYSNYEVEKLRSEFRLGIWAKTYVALGNASGPLKKIFSKSNHVRGYMLGFDLIICKIWFDISNPNILTLKIKDEKNVDSSINQK